MANEKRLIDANELLRFLENEIDKHESSLNKWGRDYAKAVKVAAKILRCFPTVDAVEVVHGHDTGRCRIFHCSKCGYGVDDIFQEDERNYPGGEFNYCPNCGAKMDGGADE